MFRKALLLLTVALASLSVVPSYANSNQIRIVGSSTVFPFSTTVVERFGKNTNFNAPIVERTGSGGGLNLFCAGVGPTYPDISNSSRRIKQSEIERCANNGITDIVEVKIGYDGITFTNSRHAVQLDVTIHELFLALAKKIPLEKNGKTQPNPYTSWDQINRSFPAIKIEVLGPPPSSGTRHTFIELVMENGCKSYDWVKTLKTSDISSYRKLCQTIREDGIYIEAGERDDLIIKKLLVNPNSFGIFGYSFLKKFSSSVHGAKINGVDPDTQSISSGNYAISRPLFFYVKKNNIGMTLGLKEYLNEFTSPQAWGENGYLTDIGLIPMVASERKKWIDIVTNLQKLSLE